MEISISFIICFSGGKYLQKLQLEASVGPYQIFVMKFFCEDSEWFFKLFIFFKKAAPT